MYCKKGDAYSNIGYYILAFVSLVILAAFIIWNFGPWATESITQESCHMSILSKSTLAERNEPLKCPTQKIIIDKVNDDKVKEEVAGLLYDAWSITGQGKIDFWDRLESRNVITGNTQCLIFTTFNFDEDVKKQRNSPFENFDKYLIETKIPGKDESYMDYLSNEIEEGIFSYVGESSLDPTKSYSIIVLSSKQSMLRAITEEISPIELGKGEATFIGLVKTENVPKLKCDRLL